MISAPCPFTLNL